MHTAGRIEADPRQNLSDTSGDRCTTSKRRKDLTPRETEIVRLVVQGMTNKEIALVLDISHWTVATHLRRIYDKTRVKRRAGLSLALVG